MSLFFWAPNITRLRNFNYDSQRYVFRRSLILCVGFTFIVHALGIGLSYGRMMLGGLRFLVIGMDWLFLLFSFRKHHCFGCIGYALVRGTSTVCVFYQRHVCLVCSRDCVFWVLQSQAILRVVRCFVIKETVRPYQVARPSEFAIGGAWRSSVLIMMIPPCGILDLLSLARALAGHFG